MKQFGSLMDNNVYETSTFDTYNKLKFGLQPLSQLACINKCGMGARPLMN